MTQFAPDVPRGADEVVRYCLRKNPEERIQSAYDVACMLEMISAGDIRMEGETAVAPKRRWPLIAAGLAIGTKLNTLPMVAVLSVFVLALATVVRRPRLVASWFAGLVAFGH